MPDFNRIIFGSDLDLGDFSKGIDGMIAGLKKAQEQGALTGNQLEKMEEAANSLRDATGKPIAPSLTDGKVLGALGDIKGGYTDLANTVNKTVGTARAKLNELIATQEGYKKSISEINGVLKANATESAQLTKQLTVLQGSSKATSSEINNLRNQLKGVNTNTELFKSELTKTQSALQATTSQIRTQTQVVSESERGHVKLSRAIANVTDGSTIAAREINNMSRRLLTFGSGFVLGAVIDLGGAFLEYLGDVHKAADATKLLSDTLDGTGTEFATAISDVSRLKEEIVLAKEGFLDKKKVVDDYNTSIGKTTGLVKSLDEAEQALNRNAEAYIKFTFLKAVANEANAEAAKKAVEAEITQAKPSSEVLTNTDAVLATLKEVFVNPLNSTTETMTAASQHLVKTAEKTKKEIVDAANADSKSLTDISKKYTDEAAKLAAQYGFNFFQDTKQDKVAKQRKEVENIYEQELQKLKADIAKIDEKGFTDEATITAAIEEDFKKRDLAFQKAFKNKQLTAGQLASLQDNLKNLQQLTLDKSLKDFATQKAAYLQKINDQLSSLQNEESLKRIANIQDNFERERQTIIEEADKTSDALKAKRDKDIADLLKNAGKNGLTEKDLQPQIDSIKNTYARLLDDLTVTKNEKLQKLSFDTFEKLSEDANRLLTAGNLGISQSSLTKIQTTTAQYQAGKISYKQYQKELTKIARGEANERFLIEKQFLEAEIQARQARLANDKSLTDDQTDKLKDEITKLQQQLADATKGNLETGADIKKSDLDKKINKYVQYAEAVGQLTQSVIEFWQLSNEAESRALDRSIALQQQRVNAAQVLAQHGNSEYLKMEEDKQNQLQLQQENAARRTLAINAAVQASQIIVALVSGIAKGVEEGGPLGAIIGAASVVAAIAGAFAIAQSLKPPVPTFFSGTEDTGHGGNVDEKGGFHSILHPHERVLTAEENKQLRGISNQQLIDTVQKHRVLVENWKSKPAPELNIAAMEMATNHATKSEAIRMEGLERRMDENNVLQKGIIRALKGMGVSVNMDRNGIAVSVMEAAEEIVKNKKL